MNHKIGDRVAFKISEAKQTDPLCHGIYFIDDLQNKGRDLRKGKITRIKTHAFFFIKLKRPVYVIDDDYMTFDVKPIITF